MASEADRVGRSASGHKSVAPLGRQVFSFHVGDDDFNEALLERVNASGEAFLSHTVIDGRYALRLATGGLLTTSADMEQTWAVLREAVAALSS